MKIDPDLLRKRKAINRIMAVFITSLSLTAVFMVLMIFVFLIKESSLLVTSDIVKTEMEELGMSIKDLFGKEYQAVAYPPKFGLQPLITSTIRVTFVAILVATPLSLMAAIYVAVFAPRWIKETVKPAIELLAGIPTVVLGFFTLIVLATWIQTVTGSEYRLNALVGGIALSFTIIPIMFTLMEDAITSVPNTMKEASLSLGATPWQTATKVLIPAAKSGMVAAFLLGASRAFGETMIALMATGNAAITTFDLLLPARTLAANIGQELGEVAFGDYHYAILFFTGFILFIVTFTFNAIANFYVGHLVSRSLGKV
ncbi:MAG: phosphate ABC transporter permease subunit PstC [Thermodesulfovibrionales bacterium]